MKTCLLALTFTAFDVATLPSTRLPPVSPLVKNDPKAWRSWSGREPFDDESLPGYLTARFAHEGLVSTVQLARLAGGQYPGLWEVVFSDLDLSEIAASLQVDQPVLDRLASPRVNKHRRRRFLDTTLGPGHLYMRSRRFSPHSLSASPHHRTLWMLRHLPVCVDSGEYLIDRCPSPDCLTLQGWKRTYGLENCDTCARPLDRAETSVASDDDLEKLRDLADLFVPDARAPGRGIAALPRSLRSIGPGAAFEMAVAIAMFLKPELRSHTAGHMMKTTASPKAVSSAMASAWQVMKGWPNAFEAIACERLAKRGQRGGDGNGGATVRFIKSAYAPSFPKAAATQIHKVENKWRRGHEHGVSLGTAMFKTSLHSERIMDLRRRLVIPTVFSLEGNVVMPLLCRATIDRMEKAKETGCTVSIAAFRLGVPGYAVEQLMCLGILEADDPIGGQRFRGPVTVSRASLAALEQKLKTLRGSESPEDETSLSLVLAAIGGMKPWGPALKLVLDAKLPFRSDGAGGPCRRIRVSERAVALLRPLRFDRADHPQFPFDPMMTKMDAAETLSLHNRHAQDALAQWPSGDRAVRSVPVEWVEHLASECITPREIMSRLCLNSAHVRWMVWKHEWVRKMSAGFQRAQVEPVLAEFARQRSIQVVR